MRVFSFLLIPFLYFLIIHFYIQNNQIILIYAAILANLNVSLMTFTFIFLILNSLNSL
jgi:hypothetical protein